MTWTSEPTHHFHNNMTISLKSFVFWICRCIYLEAFCGIFLFRDAGQKSYWASKWSSFHWRTRRCISRQSLANAKLPKNANMWKHFIEWMAWNLVWFCLIIVNSLFPHVCFSDSSNNSMSSSTQHSFKSWWDHPHGTLQFALFDVCSDNGMLEIRQLWSSNSVLIKSPLSFNQTILLLMWQHCFKLGLSVCCKNKRGTKCVTLCDYVPEKNESNICSYAFCQVANL